MAQQYLFVVEDELFALPSLKQRKPKVCGESNSHGGGVDDRLTAKIVDLPHPRTGDPSKFMIRGGNVLEIQVARPRGSELASVFIDQSVQQDGALYMASRIDPLFLLLPVLTKYATKWCPLDQALAEAGRSDLRGLHNLDAQKLCDVNDRLGPDVLLIRLNEDSVVRWLTAKVERSSKMISQLATDSVEVIDGNLPPGSLVRNRGSAQGFSLIATADDEDRRKGLEAEGRHEALEAVCEYIDEEWGRKLAEKFSTERGLLFGEKSSSTKKRKAAWEGPSEVDKHLELSHGIGDTKSNGGASAGPGAKPKQAMTSGQRSLSKVNKKGMKSISSFFSR